MSFPGQPWFCDHGDETVIVPEGSKCPRCHPPVVEERIVMQHDLGGGVTMRVTLLLMDDGSVRWDHDDSDLEPRE